MTAVLGLGLMPAVALAAPRSASAPARTALVAGPAGLGGPPGPTGASGPTGPTGPGALTLSASDAQVGFIALRVSGATSAVRLAELVPGVPAGVPLGTLTPTGGQASLARAASWRCDRLQRTFQASETLAGGATATSTVSVTTPSCATRLSISLVTSRVYRDHPLRIAITDRWGIGGLRVGACVSHAGLRPCPTVTLAPGRRATLLQLRAGMERHPLLEVFDPYESLRRRLDVLQSTPVLLATGDSEMQVLDDDLAADLAGPTGDRVISDARQSTAISSPFLFDWPAHAVQQVNADHPSVVAMFLGGNEGFELGGVNCCGPDWSRQYAIKVQGMMRVYLQHGAASVYWFLIPTPSKPQFVRVVNAVNAGIELAASRFRTGVHVLDLRPLFSPGGRYIDSLTYRGRTITVHEPDGFHLSASADVIVAQLFLARLRRDGLLS